MNRMFSIYVAIFFFASITLSGVVSASAAAGGIELKTLVEKEVVVSRPDGTQVRQRVPAAKVIPGDEVIYTIRVKNVGAKAVADVVVTDPVPEHTHYQEGTATGPETIVQFSVDGGVSYKPREQLMMKMPNGQVRPAIASDYTHIRWQFKQEIAAGATKQVQFRAKLR